MKSNFELDYFCKNIRYLRKQHGLSQKEMARRLKIGVGSLRKIEAGEIPPNLKIDVLWSVHEVFAVRTDDILGQPLDPKEKIR